MEEDGHEKRKRKEDRQSDDVPVVDRRVLVGLGFFAQLAHDERLVRNVVERLRDFVLEEMRKRTDEADDADDAADCACLAPTGSHRPRQVAPPEPRRQDVLEGHHDKGPDARVPQPLVDATHVAVHVLVRVAMTRVVSQSQGGATQEQDDPERNDPQEVRVVRGPVGLADEDKNADEATEDTEGHHRGEDVEDEALTDKARPLGPRVSDGVRIVGSVVVTGVEAEQGSDRGAVGR